MNLNKEVIGKRRKLDKIMLVVMPLVVVALFIVLIIGIDFKNIGEEEIIALVICSVLIVGLGVFCLVMLKKLPEELIVYDKENNTLELRCGQTIGQQMKTIVVNINDISSVRYVKAEYRYYVVVSTMRSAYLEIVLKNGRKLGVTALKKPHNVEEIIQRLVFQQNNQD